MRMDRREQYASMLVELKEVKDCLAAAEEERKRVRKLEEVNSRLIIYFAMLVALR